MDSSSSEDTKSEVTTSTAVKSEKTKRRRVKTEKNETSTITRESSESSPSDLVNDEDYESKVIISNKLVYQKQIVMCTLTKTKFIIVREPKSGSIRLDDIFAVHENQTLSNTNKSLFCFSIFTYNRNLGMKFVHDFYCFKPEELQQWVTVLRCVVFQAPMSMPDMMGPVAPSSSSSASSSDNNSSAYSVFSSLAQFNKKRKLLVILNPFSGQKKGRSYFCKYARPILDVSHLQYVVKETEGPLHATKIVQSLNLKEYTEIACVGGDGILNEVVNGLLKREDWQNAIKTPIAVMPCGTSNAIAAVVKTPDVEKAAFAIARGYYQPIDIFSVFQGNNRYFAILSVNWAAIADADHGTENIRFMGNLRNHIGALKTIAKMKYYKATFKYIPYQASQTPRRTNYKRSLFGISPSAPARKHSRAKLEPRNAAVGETRAAAFGGNGPECPLLNKYFTEEFLAVQSRPNLSNTKKTSSETAPLLKNQVISYNSTTPKPSMSIQNPETSPPTTSMAIPAPVTTNVQEEQVLEITDDFFAWVAMSVSHLALDVKAAPNAQMDNGAFDVIMIRKKKKLARGTILNVFMEIENGKHIEYDEVDEVRAKAFMLDPISTGSYVSVDGECIQYEPVFCEVHPALANIICL